jgi:murein DD-endopeptidase MepM/ murein hydrolase activator NlpD
MFRSRSWLPLVLVLLAAGTPLEAKPVDASIGVCTRKDEFAKRQKKLDAVVADLGMEQKASKRKSLVRKLVKVAKKDIECLIRYREPHLLPVFADVAKSGKLKWFTRARALYALKMLGLRDGVAPAARLLGDGHAMVREAAASALGHLGGADAVAALEARLAKEQDPYVRATIESAVALAGAETRPYDSFPGEKTWEEKLEGPEGARRVAWDWTVKGQKLFNAYDAKAMEYPTATSFVYPIHSYEEDLFAGYPRNSFAAGGTHAGEDCAWFREGSGMYAIADGIVRMVQGAGGDWGFLVAIEHRLQNGRHMTSVYGHLAFDVLVKAGDVVKAGQRIGTQGLSCSVENGGYGSHLHFGLGDGPFRRPAKLAVGDKVGMTLDDGKKVPVPVIRFAYAPEKTNSYGWPLTAFVVERPDGTEQVVEVPEQPVGQELGWFQAYVKGCRGWLNPQRVLPDLVGGE